MEAKTNGTNPHLTIGVNDHIPTGQAILLGLQHVLAMDVYVVPFIIAAAVSMSPGEASGLIQSTFLGAGIASLIQVLFFLKLPVCQGPSFVPVGAIIGIYLGGNEYCEQIEPPVRMIEPASAINRATQCERESH